MNENETNMKYLELMLKLADSLYSKDVENAKAAAAEMGKLDLTEDQENSAGDLMRTNFPDWSYEELAEIVESLNLENGELIVAYIECDLKLQGGLKFTSESVKETKAYKIVTSEMELTEVEKYNLMNPLVLMAIQSKDRELIKELLDMLNGSK